MPKTNNLVVFGNPPYQKEDGGHAKSAKPIYNLFIESIIDNLNPRYLSFIIPSRWMAGGKGLGKFRERMMQDKRIRLIRHFSGCYTVFTEVKIGGGVSYFLWDREYEGKCNFDGNYRYLDDYDVIISDNKAITILDKVKSSHKKDSFLDSKCLGRKPFGLATNFSDWKESGIPCCSIGRVNRFVAEDSFTDKNKVQNLWKVCTTKVINLNKKDGHFEVYNTLFIAEPKSVCTETYIVVNTFDSQAKAENFMEYMKTKFFRFMLGLRVVGQDINKEKFAFVPDLGDYSKPVTDAELYKKFGLSEEEIAYIESKIKALE